MSSKAERDKKADQERLQTLLNSLLKDEDNKYCADCDAKGPRWASWNLGIFLCIRCAGIHRNLGVHISKVKSVNLDTWTVEQVAMVKTIGNSVARGVYECNLPEGFRRPQSDSSVESFIRQKYDQKRYIMKDWIPPRNDPRHLQELLEDSHKKKKVTQPSAPEPVPPPPGGMKTATNLSATVDSSSTKRSPRSQRKEVTTQSNTGALLDLSSPTKQSSAQQLQQTLPANDLDILRLDNPSPVMASSNVSSNNFIPNGSSSVRSSESPQVAPMVDVPASNADLLGDMGALNNEVSELNLIGSDKKSTSDIMKLYGSTTSNQMSSSSMGFGPMISSTTAGSFTSPQTAIPAGNFFGVPPQQSVGVPLQSNQFQQQQQMGYGQQQQHVNPVMSHYDSSMNPVGMPQTMGMPQQHMFSNVPPGAGIQQGLFPQGTGMPHYQSQMAPGVGYGVAPMPGMMPQQQHQPMMSAGAMPHHQVSGMPQMQNQFTGMQLGPQPTLSTQLWQ